MHWRCMDHGPVVLQRELSSPLVSGYQGCRISFAADAVDMTSRVKSCEQEPWEDGKT